MLFHVNKPEEHLNGGIHIWTASLEQDDKIISLLIRMLSGDEIDKAYSYRFQKDTRNQIASRGILRSILGFYLSVDPRDLKFEYGKNGKPYLTTSSSDKQILFNVSHSGNRVVYAFSENHEIGIDIEIIREIPEISLIADKYFSKYEIGILNSLPAGSHKEAFFNCWTRKEAFIKASGDGFLKPLDAFDVPFESSESEGILKIDGSRDEAELWTLKGFNAAPGYASAFAIKKIKTTEIYYSWDNIHPFQILPFT
jgi:4'-phosphopantetheinyl transferase